MNSVPTKKKGMGYDVDQEPRTDHNKGNSPIEPTPRKEEWNNIPTCARTHKKSHRGIRRACRRGFCVNLPHAPPASSRSNSQKGKCRGLVVKSVRRSTVRRSIVHPPELAVCPGPGQSTHIWMLSPPSATCDRPVQSSQWAGAGCPSLVAKDWDLSPEAWC